MPVFGVLVLALLSEAPVRSLALQAFDRAARIRRRALAAFIAGHGEQFEGCYRLLSPLNLDNTVRAEVDVGATFYFTLASDWN